LQALLDENSARILEELAER